MGTVKVLTAGQRGLSDNDDKANQDKQKGSGHHGSVDWEPLEHGPSVSTDQDASRHQQEPSYNHKDHVGDDDIVALVEDTSAAILIRARLERTASAGTGGA